MGLKPLAPIVFVFGTHTMPLNSNGQSFSDLSKIFVANRHLLLIFFVNLTIIEQSIEHEERGW